MVFGANPNQLAADPDSAIVVAVADVLQQARNLRKWSPLPVFGLGFTEFPVGLFPVRFRQRI